MALNIMGSDSMSVEVLEEHMCTDAMPALTASMLSYIQPLRDASLWTVSPRRGMEGLL